MRSYIKKKTQSSSSPYYNESHRKLRKFVRDFVEKEIMPFCHEWDEAKAIPKELFIKTAKAGFQGAIVGHVDAKLLPYALPANIETGEWDNFHSLIVTDELARCGSGGVSVKLPPLSFLIINFFGVISFFGRYAED